MTKANTMSLLLVALIGPAACAHGERPSAEVPVAAQTGPPVASYEIPEQGPKGMLHVVSMGIEALPAGPGGEAAPFLHLRLAALNGSDTATWFLDPTEQVVVAGEVNLPPSFAEASAGGPILEVERGQRGHLDLYYPAPTGDPGTVALSWRLARGSLGAVVDGRTELRRVNHDNRRYAYYRPADDLNVSAGLGLGSWWWNDYYFWNDGDCWWGYRRAHFHSHYPRYHRPPYYAGDGGGGGGGGGHPVSNPDRGGLSQERETSFWRETPRDTSPQRSESSSQSTSSWRNPPEPVSHDSSSSASSSSPSPSPSPSPAPAPPPSDDGKSSWRGGGGP